MSISYFVSSFTGWIDDLENSPGSNLTNLVPQDNFSWVPDYSLELPKCEKNVPKNLFGLCENGWLLVTRYVIFKYGDVPTKLIITQLLLTVDF